MYDDWGNPTCGQDFMAGTICTDVPGHSGPHSARCQRCGLDWYDHTCTCVPLCRNCTSYVSDTPDDATSPYCDECACITFDDRNSDRWCQLMNEHAGEHDFTEYVLDLEIKPPTEEELAEVYKSLGVTPMQ